MTTTARHKLLVAVRPQDRDLVLSCLGDEFELILAYSFGEAVQQLEQDVGMVICGVHFDEGRMFDLLQIAKADSGKSPIPFVPVLSGSSNHAEGIRRGIRSAALSLGADDFIDLPELAATQSIDQICAMLRGRIRNALR